MQLLDSRHLSMVKKSQGWTSAEHPNGTTVQILARTGRWINDFSHVLYDCADTFPVTVFPLVYSFTPSLLLFFISAMGAPSIFVLYPLRVSLFFVLCIVANLSGKALEPTKRTSESLNGNI